jgi:hypothetical protein
MRLYVWHCDRCNQLIPSTATLGKSKDDAWGNDKDHAVCEPWMQDLVKNHELLMHPDVMDTPRGRVVHMVPSRREKRL